MTSQESIVNRVAQSALVTLDLEEYYHQGERVLIDIKDWLYQGLVLKEKDFRRYVKDHNWDQYNGQNVALTCSVDAIVPTWAYMLLTTKLASHVNLVVIGDHSTLEESLFKEALLKINFEDFLDKKVVVKGCSKLPVPDFAYVEVTRLLMPYVSSIMYGEPCSTVPLYKKPQK